MTFLVPIALFGWPIFQIALFALIGNSRRALLAGVVSGMLFLPMAGYDLPVISITKFTAIPIGALLGVMLFDFGRLMAFRFRWIDLPVLLMCMVPIGTSLSNGLGLYEGVTGMINRLVGFGILYILGRVYIDDRKGVRDAMLAVAIGGLVYVPLCLIESRFSPQLHRLVYGYHQHSFAQTIRHGGFRPTVFMQHGLAVASWMVAATICAFAWMKTRPDRGDHRSIYAFWVLVFTVVILRSTNAWLMLPLALGTLWFGHALRTRWFLVCFCAFPLVYVTVRLTQVVSREQVAEVASLVAPPERVGSLDARLRQEDAFGRHTAERRWWGWGGWMRSFPTDENGRRITRGVDSLWVITYSQNGLIGLSLLLMTHLTGPAICAWRLGSQPWRDTYAVQVCGLAMILIVYMTDSLANGMPSCVYILILGGVSTSALGALSPSRSEAVSSGRAPTNRNRRGHRLSVSGGGGLRGA